MDYARQVVAQNPRAVQQFRLFLAPGVGHCGGGAGADVLPVTDVISSWVHTNTAPETVVATKRDKSLTRLDCAWPKVAHYNGSSEPNDPSSWECVGEGGPASRPGERG
jgi:feruloyl esterase